MERAADAGDLNSMLVVAQAYYNGAGLPKDQ